MRTITFEAATAYLLDDFPDWVAPIELKAILPSHDELGLTGRESRRPLASSLRFGLVYQVVLEGSAATDFRKCLEVLSTEQVLCPLWMHPIQAGDTPDITSDYYVLMGDGLDPTIEIHGALPFARPAYPLMVGHLDQQPDPKIHNAEVISMRISFVESDDRKLTLPVYSPNDGPDAGGSPRPLCLFTANWQTQPSGGTFKTEIERRGIGYRREIATAFYDQSGRRNLQYKYQLADLEPWQFLRFFLDRGGSAQNFWLPGAISDAQLASNVQATDISIETDRNYPYADTSEGYILLDDLVNQKAVKVTSGGSTTWTLSGQVGQAFTASQTRIDSLILARFKSDRLSVFWENSESAELIASFVEVPDEITAPSGETIGTTMGALATQAYLYRFFIEYPDATEAWYYTNFETQLSWAGQAYGVGDIEHSDITEDISFRRHEFGLRLRHLAGGPISRLVPFTLEYPLMVQVIEADVLAGAVTDARTLFLGEIVSASTDGPFVQCTARAFHWLLERQIPRRLFQRPCNYSLFEPGCGVSASDWKWQGTISAYNAGTLELALGSVSRVSGPAVTLTQHYFATGYLVLSSGISAQYVSIGDNAAAVGSDITLVLMAGFNTAPSGGENVFFYPGCDGLYSTCINKFDNAMRFGGCPFIPVGNPSMLKITKNVSSGGKK